MTGLSEYATLRVFLGAGLKSPRFQFNQGIRDHGEVGDEFAVIAHQAQSSLEGLQVRK